MDTTAPTPFPVDLPTPDSAARVPALAGVDVALADGRTWTLADHVPSFGLVWDRLYDGNIVALRYNLDDLRLGGARLLQANYDLAADHAAWLIAGADPTDLVRAIEAALFGFGDAIRSWSEWAEAALRANGIDPDDVPPPMLRPVLDHLVFSKRAVAHLDYTSAGIAARKRAALRHVFDESRKYGPKAAVPAGPRTETTP